LEFYRLGMGNYRDLTWQEGKVTTLRVLTSDKTSLSEAVCAGSKVEPDYKPSFDAPFTTNNSPFRMYFRSVVTLRWPAVRMMTSSGTPARAAVVT